MLKKDVWHLGKEQTGGCFPLSGALLGAAAGPVIDKKKHELQQKELEDLALLLKFNINLSEKQICFKVFKQKVKLTNKSIVHHYIFCGFFI